MAKLLGSGRIMFDFLLYPLTQTPDLDKYLLPKIILKKRSSNPSHFIKIVSSLFVMFHSLDE